MAAPAVGRLMTLGFQFIAKDALTPAIRNIGRTIGIFIPKAGKQFKKLSEQIQEGSRSALVTGLAFAGLAQQISGMIDAVARKAANMLKSMAKSAADFESTMATFQIITGRSGEALAELRNEIIKTTAPLPTSAAELAKATIEFARMGLASDRTAKQIANMGLTAVMLGRQIGVSDKAAALMLGRLSVFLRVGPESFERIGSTLAKVAFSVRATADEVFRATERFGAFARALGATPEQVIALAAMVRDSGLQIRRGSTAINRALQQMAINTRAFGAALQKEGVVPLAEFVKTFDSDPVRAFQFVLEGVNKAQGRNAVIMLKTLGLTGNYISDLITMASNQDRFTRTLKISSGEIGKGTQLTIGFRIQMQTFTQQAKTLRGAVENLGIMFGTFLLPIMKGVTLVIRNIIEAVIELSPFWRRVIGVTVITILVLAVLVSMIKKVMFFMALMKLAGFAASKGLLAMAFAMGLVLLKVIAVIVAIAILIFLVGKVIEFFGGPDIFAALGKGIESAVESSTRAVKKGIEKGVGPEGISIPVTAGAGELGKLGLGGEGGIPGFANGGIVPGTGTQGRLAVVHPGEFVIPSSGFVSPPAASEPAFAGAGGAVVETIQVPITVNLDGREIASQLEEISVQDHLRSGGMIG